MNKAAQSITVKVRDRVTFDTDEGIQAGYVNGLRRDVGNGELHAWVEVDHLLPGCFRAVPVADILTSDQVGPPSAMYFGFDPVKDASEFTRVYLCNFETNEKSESASQ
jgi:hypothetical protein